MQSFGKLGASKVELVDNGKFLKGVRIDTRAAPVENGNRLTDPDVERSEITMAQGKWLSL